MNRAYFVTGTDTEVGKTYITCGLLRMAIAAGIRSCGLKPIASGSDLTDHGLRNADALQIQQNSAVALDYHQLNPFCFEPAIAPHLAAHRVGQIITVKKLHEQVIIPEKSDLTFIEGAGGWLVPLNHNETFADYVEYCQWPIILVIGMRLGCINHSLMTAAVIQQRGLRLAGWVANFLESGMPADQENLLTLQKMLKAPFLGQVPYGAKPEHCLNIENLFF